MAKSPQNRIKEILRQQGKTQVWLADQLDLEFQTVTNYANNKRQPRFEMLCRIAGILKVPPGELFKC